MDDITNKIETALREASKLYAAQENSWRKSAEYIANHIKSDGWRPISEAPKDGTWILAYWPTMSLSIYPRVIFWDGDINRDSWVMPDNIEYGEVYPTLWMPLPLAPQLNKEQSNG